MDTTENLDQLGVIQGHIELFTDKSFFWDELVYRIIITLLATIGCKQARHQDIEAMRQEKVRKIKSDQLAEKVRAQEQEKNAKAEP